MKIFDGWLTSNSWSTTSAPMDANVLSTSAASFFIVVVPLLVLVDRSMFSSLRSESDTITQRTSSATSLSEAGICTTSV